MTAITHLALTRSDLDSLAWSFLRSEFTAQIYASWPIDRRLQAFLRHNGHSAIADRGEIYETLLQHVMDNIGRAHRSGILAARSEAAP